ncbi:MAG: PHP domain-containing protein [Spirochaetota bacterium]|nr:PHP domain-containing protein [Spirochaetota bacterium]
MLLKLDLHTHCYEATESSSIETVEKIINAVKASGLDGIAITEHADKNYAYKVKEIVEDYFNNEILIIPGQEIYTDLVYIQVVELYLPGDVTFKYIPHPYHIYDFFRYFNGHSYMIHGIEIDNYQHDWEMKKLNKDRIYQLAEEYNLMLLSNSDAHSLNNIGRYYNEIELEELYRLVEKKDKYLNIVK